MAELTPAEQLVSKLVMAEMNGRVDNELNWMTAGLRIAGRLHRAVPLETVRRITWRTRAAYDEAYRVAPPEPPPLYEDVDGQMKPANELSVEGYKRHCRVEVAFT